MNATSATGRFNPFTVPFEALLVRRISEATVWTRPLVPSPAARRAEDIERRARLARRAFAAVLYAEMP